MIVTALRHCILLIIFSVLTGFVLVKNAAAQSLVINEVMFDNTTFADQFGNYPPWFELYNRGENPIQLSNYYLTNDPLQPEKWIIPHAVLMPDSSILIFASAGNIVAAQPFHTNFTIENNVNGIYLFTKSGEMDDASPAECVRQNKSVGRLPDGSEDWELLSAPSPGSTNNIAWAESNTWPETNLSFSHASGFYSDPFALSINVEGDFDVYYTFNTGAAPNQHSSLSSGSIWLYERKAESNNFSTIQTTEFAVDFKAPATKIKKSNVVRAVAYAEGCPVSPVITGNFLIDASDHPYPAEVVFVNTDPDNLFDPLRGMYVYGENENYNERGDLWERPANFEFISPDGEVLLNQNGGVRIHGGGTRQGVQKSLRMYARQEYGNSHFEYPFFEDRPFTEYKRLLLRTSMGDWSGTLFKDHLCHYIVRDLNVSYQAGIPAVVFLNGEYWGVHALRERQDKHYLESHFDVDKNNLEIIEYSLIFGGVIVEEGNGFNYASLIEFIDQHDLREEVHYDYISEIIDIPNFIDQHIAQLYFANTDFPDNNNSFWRKESSGGIWRWLFFDCDACMLKPYFNHIFENIGDSDFHTRSPAWAMQIFRALLRNEQFKNQFVSRFRTLLNTTFSSGTVIDAIDKFEKMYAPLVAEHIERWHYPISYRQWESHVQSLRYFAMNRPVFMNDVLERYFGKPFVVYPNPGTGPFTVLFTGIAETGVVALYDSSGALVEHRDYTDHLMEQITFNDGLTPGIYLLRVEVNGSFYSEKVVVGSR